MVDWTSYYKNPNNHPHLKWDDSYEKKSIKKRSKKRETLNKKEIKMKSQNCIYLKELKDFIKQHKDWPDESEIHIEIGWDEKTFESLSKGIIAIDWKNWIVSDLIKMSINYHFDSQSDWEIDKKTRNITYHGHGGMKGAIWVDTKNVMKNKEGKVKET